MEQRTPAGGLSAERLRGDAPGRAEEEPRSPRAELDTVRRLVTERLAAAVDDILEVFATAVVRYRDQIDRQRRQLDALRSEEDRRSRTGDPLQAFPRIKTHPDDPVHSVPVHSVQLDQTGSPDEMLAGPSVAQIKTEGGGGGGGGASEPDSDSDPVAGSEGASDDTEDSGDYWGDGGPPEDPEGQSPAGGAAVTRSAASRPPASGCNFCGESFRGTGDLLGHAAAHSGDCGVCGRRLEDSESLRVHRPASYRCGVCGHSFTLRGNLRTHMRIHSGERPFGCSICGKSFGRRATLVRHVRSHTGEKPFSCDVCGRGFVEKGNLTVHLRTHTGERPYWCSACDRRFSQLSCFYRHPCQRRAQDGHRPDT